MSLIAMTCYMFRLRYAWKDYNMWNVYGGVCDISISIYNDATWWYMYMYMYVNDTTHGLKCINRPVYEKTGICYKIIILCKRECDYGMCIGSDLWHCVNTICRCIWYELYCHVKYRWKENAWNKLDRYSVCMMVTHELNIGMIRCLMAILLWAERCIETMI